MAWPADQVARWPVDKLIPYTRNVWIPDPAALPASPVTMDDLEQVINNPALLPPGIEVSGLGAREYAFQQPGLSRKVRISTNPSYYEQNADNVELWSPGNPTFPPLAIGPEAVQADSLAELLQRSAKDAALA